MRANLNDELKHYLKDVAKSKVLTRDEEISLFKRLSKGDETAREEIVEANLRFVIKIALSYSGRGVAIAERPDDQALLSAARALVKQSAS